MKSMKLTHGNSLRRSWLWLLGLLAIGASTTAARCGGSTLPEFSGPSDERPGLGWDLYVNVIGKGTVSDDRGLLKPTPGQNPFAPQEFSASYGFSVGGVQLTATAEPGWKFDHWETVAEPPGSGLNIKDPKNPNQTIAYSNPLPAEVGQFRYKAAFVEGEPSPSNKIGDVFFNSTSSKVGNKVVNSSGASAQFFDRSQSSGTGNPLLLALVALVSCPTETFGECTVVQACTEPGNPVNRSAGNITISGGLRTVILTPNADRTYTPIVDPNNKLWNGGETMTVQAVGADVPAFTGAVTAPKQPTVTTPGSVKLGETRTIDRAVDFPFTWTNGGVGTVTVVMTAAFSPTIVSCVFPAARGNGTVPTAALQKLPPGNGGIVISPRSVTTLAAGQVNVTLTAFTPPLAADGTLFNTGFIVWK